MHPYCKTHNPTPNPLLRILRIIPIIYWLNLGKVMLWKFK
jgi:hypothetical protein